MSWSGLERSAPELARLGHERLVGGLALLGTVRADGSPRVSPIGVFFIDGEIVVGVMTTSGKARDLRRDPRCAVQSLVTRPDEGEPELKLYGHVEASDADGGWWVGGRAGVDVYRIDIDEAVYIEWQPAAERMRIRRWTHARGEVSGERAYP